MKGEEGEEEEEGRERERSEWLDEVGSRWDV